MKNVIKVIVFKSLGYTYMCTDMHTNVYKHPPQTNWSKTFSLIFFCECLQTLGHITEVTHWEYAISETVECSSVQKRMDSPPGS